MSPTTIFVFVVVATALLAAVAVFLVAYRREPSDGPVTGALDRGAIRADRAARAEAAAEDRAKAAVAVLEREAETPVSAEPLPDPIQHREEISESDFGVTRRQFFNRSLLGIFGIFLAQFAIAGLAFFWPKLKGGFGTPISAGNINDLRAQIVQEDGTQIPVFVPAAQAWVVTFDLAQLPGSSFENLPAPVTAGGEDGELALMALWQRCVHLGCRVPECTSSQGFECPCHGSRYNFHGEYEAGPAPRNLDRFEVSADAGGNLIVNTGTILQTPRAKKKTIAYPQGPSCL